MDKDITPEIRRFESVDSTNSKCKQLGLLGMKEGTIVVAQTQTRGRGRGTRQWHSPQGGLYLSALLHPRDPKRITDLALLAGAALAQATREFLPKAVDVSLKWPNDLLINWKKVGGILCEALGEEAHHACAVGIGLNVNVPDSELTPFLSNPFSATSLMAESGSERDVDEVLNMVVTKLFNLYVLYHRDGFKPIHYLWEKNCHMIGKRIELSDSGWRKEELSEASSPGSTIGTFEGIDESGALVLSNQRGERRQYVTGEITCFWP